MSNTKQYHPGKLKPFAQIIARMVQKNPELAENPDHLWATIISNIPSIANKERCPNCDGSMAEYVFEFGVIDVALIYGMARKVRERMEAGADFTTANQIHLPSMTDLPFTVRQRVTYTSKLGLIAKLKGKNGRHVGGTWVITRRGWDALRGEAVPKSVRVWHGQILERTEETVTIDDIIRAYGGMIKAMEDKNKDVKTDYRNELGGYAREEWVHIAGYHEGAIL